jgi:hypothetical protein
MINKFEVLQNYVTQMMALERQLMEMIETYIDDRTFNRYPKALESLRMIHPVMRSHVATLESLVARNETGPIWREAVSTVTNVVYGLYGRMRPEKTSTLLRDMYMNLNLISVNYSMLHTTALALKDNDTAELALRHLKAVTPLVINLSEVIPRVVLEELVGDQVDINAGIGEEAVRNTHEAWRMNPPTTAH